MQTITNREGFLIFKLHRMDPNAVHYCGEALFSLTFMIQNVSAYQIALPAIALQYTGISARLINDQTAQQIDLPANTPSAELLEQMICLQPGDSMTFRLNIAKHAFTQIGYPDSTPLILNIKDRINFDVLNNLYAYQTQTCSFMIDERYTIFCETII